jgi:succinylarginine dihydrolase
MTELHADFLPASGAVVIVVCTTANVLGYHAQAFERQLKFAHDVAKKIKENNTIAGIPIILLLVDDDITRHVCAIQHFSALITIDDYTTAALTNAVRVLFEK